jgi:leucyl-tRNA synthetase
MAAQATMKLENTEKRDALKTVEEKYQKLWQDQQIFEVDAPPADAETKPAKFFGTMAYPYVNGVPHLGMYI